MVNGMDIHYAVAGEGPPIVFLHGLGASCVTWQENIGPLSERFTVYTPDIPGHGDSVKLGVEYTVEAGVSFILGFLDAVGAQNAALAGSSMGGLIALQTALQRPERVSHLVLINSAGFGREIAGYLRVMSLPLLGEFLEGPTHRSAKAMMKLVFGPRKEYPEALFEELVRARSLPGGRDAVLRSLRVGVNLMGMKREHRLLDRLRELQMPLMIVWGALDPVFPLEARTGRGRGCAGVAAPLLPQRRPLAPHGGGGAFQRRGDGVPSWRTGAMTSERRTP